MTKFVQIEILVENDSKKLESSSNKFLIDKKMQRKDLIDIQFQASDGYRRAFVIYEIDMEEK